MSLFIPSLDSCWLDFHTNSGPHSQLFATDDPRNQWSFPDWHCSDPVLNDTNLLDIDINDFSFLGLQCKSITSCNGTSPDLVMYLVPPSPSGSFSTGSSPSPPPPESVHVVCNAPLVAPIPLPYHSPTFLQFERLPDIDDDLSHPPYTQRSPGKRKRLSDDGQPDVPLRPSKRRAENSCPPSTITTPNRFSHCAPSSTRRHRPPQHALLRYHL
jgi:hypothetical protein